MIPLVAFLAGTAISPCLLAGSISWLLPAVGALGRKIRQLEFAASMAALRVPETNGEMLDFPDGKDRLDWNEVRLRGYVQSLIDYFECKVVASHNADGEYGHPQHMLVHRLPRPWSPWKRT
jgi:LmbE family N-acetylglucosaminyl deacetylase